MNFEKRKKKDHQSSRNRENFFSFCASLIQFRINDDDDLYYIIDNERGKQNIRNTIETLSLLDYIVDNSIKQITNITMAMMIRQLFSSGFQFLIQTKKKFNVFND